MFGICRRSCEKLAIPVGSSSKMFGVGEKQQEEEEKTILLGFLTLGKTRERKKIHLETECLFFILMHLSIYFFFIIRGKYDRKQALLIDLYLYSLT